MINDFLTDKIILNQDFIYSTSYKLEDAHSETLKLENVTGKRSKAEANIAGITPAAFIFKGKCEESPPYILFPICLLG